VKTLFVHKKCFNKMKRKKKYSWFLAPVLQTHAEPRAHTERRRGRLAALGAGTAGQSPPGARGLCRSAQRCSLREAASDTGSEASPALNAGLAPADEVKCSLLFYTIPINKISHRCPPLSLNLANRLKKLEQVILTVTKTSGKVTLT